MRAQNPFSGFPSRTVLALLFSAVALAACKDATLDPGPDGGIAGTVRDFETGEPVDGAGVTTSPPTDALVTGADGAFRYEGVPAGNYTITASRSGYDANTITVSVRPDRDAEANLFLQRRDTTAAGRADGLRVDVLNVLDRVERDSASVRVEYRVANTGSAPIPYYEAYFRIETSAGPFFQEETGRDLGVDQEDLGQFEKDVAGARVDTVVVERFFFEGQ